MEEPKIGISDKGLREAFKKAIKRNIDGSSQFLHIAEIMPCVILYSEKQNS